MTYTIITLSAVNLVLFFWLYKLIRYCFIRPFAKWKSQENGCCPSREALILSVNSFGNGKKPLLELEILFENFSGYPIQNKIRFRDTKPHLNRFRKDEQIRIVLDSRKKPGNPISHLSGKYRVSIVHMLLYTVLMVAYVAGCYFLMGETISRVLASPEYYERLFSRFPKTAGPLLISASTLIFVYFLFRGLGLLTTTKAKLKNWGLLYYGHGAMASVREYQDTGTLINDNPVVKLSYTFLDQKGHIIEGSDTKVVGKFEMVALPDIREVEVMYLPSEPSSSRLTTNLKHHDFSRFVNLCMLSAFLVFSAILIVKFFSEIF